MIQSRIGSVVRMFRILQNLLDLLHFVTIRYQVFEFSERALGGIGAW